jgi:rare lipoprotein A
VTGGACRARSGALAAPCLAALLAACAHRPQAPAEAPSGGARAAVEVGLASYYSQGLQGRRTASGERYDPHAFTCAHRHHPFGTRLRVTALESGRSVEVRVNDRGPFAEGRVVDLSLAAAKALGMLSAGVIRVRVEPVGAGAPGS